MEATESQILSPIYFYTCTSFLKFKVQIRFVFLSLDHVVFVSVIDDVIITNTPREQREEERVYLANFCVTVCHQRKPGQTQAGQDSEGRS